MSIYAWRAWVVRYNQVFQDPYLNTELRLHSVNYPSLWLPDEPEVALCPCRRPNLDAYPPVQACHRPPAPDATCGIYATKTPGIPLGYIGPMNYEPHGVLGVVELWGRIIPHQHGYRAQFARPVALAAEPRDYQTVDRLGATYHIPVLPTIQALGKEFGLESPAPCEHSMPSIPRMRTSSQPAIRCHVCGVSVGI